MGQSVTPGGRAGGRGSLQRMVCGLDPAVLTVERVTSAQGTLLHVEVNV